MSILEVNNVITAIEWEKEMSILEESNSLPPPSPKYIRFLSRHNCRIELAIAHKRSNLIHKHKIKAQLSWNESVM